MIQRLLPSLVAVSAAAVLIVVIPGPGAERIQGQWHGDAPACGGAQVLTPQGLMHASGDDAGKVSTEASLRCGQLPQAFIENQGQWEEGGLFFTRKGPMAAWLGEAGWTFSFTRLVPEARPSAENSPEGHRGLAPREGVAVRMTFEGATGKTPPSGEGLLPGYHNFFLGNDPSRWRSHVPGYGRVSYRELYPGVDVVVREGRGLLEYDLQLTPGADLDQVSVTCEGIESLTLESDGTLVMQTILGPVRQPPPATWQVRADGGHEPLVCHYRIIDARTFGFEVSEWNPGLELVVDPGLIWASYLGGSGGSNEIFGVAKDANGNITVGGETGTSNFPTTPGAFDTTASLGSDGFVTRFNPTGTQLVWSTYLAGTVHDQVRDVAVDSTGNVTAFGSTGSADFPTTAASWSPTFSGGGADYFVTRLDPSGSSLVYSTYLGGSGSDQVEGALALAGNGDAVLVGTTTSTDFPTTPGAFDTTYNGNWDIFVTRLDATGSSLLFSTYLGGATSSEDSAAVALAPSGVVTVTGATSGSSDFPTTPGAFATTSPGGFWDGFVSRLTPDGSVLLWSTFLGGSSTEWPDAVVIDDAGATTVVGRTQSSDFPTTPGAFDTSLSVEDAFVTRLSPTGSSLLWSTFLGGSGQDSASSLLLGAGGKVTVLGLTGSSDLPVTSGAYDSTHNGLSDLFVATMDPHGTRILYSSYLGGSYWDRGWDMTAGPGELVTAAGRTDSADFPVTPGAFDTTYNNPPSVYPDGFVAHLELLPAGVALFGAASGSCPKLPAIGVAEGPQVGNGSFAVTCGDAPPGGLGIVAFSSLQLQPPIQAAGISVLIDVTGSFLWFPASSDGLGWSEVVLPIPNSPWLAGIQVFGQFAWPDPCAPGGLTASNGVAITVQP